MSEAGSGATVLGSSMAQERVSRVFEFLKALHEMRSPPPSDLAAHPWVLRLADLPRGYDVRIRPASTYTEAEEPESESAKGEAQARDPIVTVRRPALTDPPAPPELLRPWIIGDWRDPASDIQHHPERQTSGESEGAEPESFEHDPVRVQLWRRWLGAWNAWAEAERPARQAMVAYERFFALHGRLQREGEAYELVVGDGLLHWQPRPGVTIHHPVLLQPVDLVFDPALPMFSVVESDRPAEFYGGVFTQIEDMDGSLIRAFRARVEGLGLHPLADDETTLFLQDLATSLRAGGSFVEGRPLAPAGNEPVIGRDPVLILRRRGEGFSRLVERILEDIGDGGEIPPSILRITGIEPDADAQAAADDPRDGPPEVLLSKEANQEQVRIAQRLAETAAVLVQGPPGTGKSHTIANLVGHLLAQGKRVLVTSHTSKALRVLRDKISEPLRPLCVSVLETDQEGREQLEIAVSAIVSALDGRDVDQLRAEAARIRGDREQLLARLHEVEQRLADARRAEYEPISLDGRMMSPADAAREVAATEAAHGWVPGPITPGAQVPIDRESLERLYATNVTVPPEAESELIESLPPRESVLQPGQFKALLGDLLDEAELADRAEDRCWRTASAADDPTDLEALARAALLAVEPLADEDGWQLAIVAAGRRAQGAAAPWHELVGLIEDTLQAAANAQAPIIRHAPVLPPDLPLEEAARLAAELAELARTRGSIGFGATWLRPDRRRFLRQATVDGKPPTLAEHFEALAAQADLMARRKELCSRWDRLMVPLKAPASAELGAAPELACEQYVHAIRSALAWTEQTWAPVLAALDQAGFDWDRLLSAQPPDLRPNGDLLRLRDAAAGPLQACIARRVRRVRHERAVRALDAFDRALSPYAGRTTQALRAAARSTGPNAYGEAYERLEALRARDADLRTRFELLRQLESSAPGWADAIRLREGVHGSGQMPGDPVAAWRWRQLSQELDRRSAVDLVRLTRERATLRADLQRVTAELIEAQAWLHQITGTGREERQALVGWADTMRRIGRGTGRRAPLLRAQARRLMESARTAVPVWIMPLSRVFESFDPRDDRFDVVIIDEASQSDITSLAALYIGRQAVIVGDHEQVSPLGVGANLAPLENLIAQYLQDIPNAHLYDGRTSVYDLARQSFGTAIPLIEHFRCVPEIIEFSNGLSYDRRIRPLRDGTSARVGPPVVELYVPGAESRHKRNLAEAWLTTALLASCIEQPEYEDHTFGVISLVGEEQAIDIETLLVRHVKPEELRRRQVVCGSSAQFQGDERDVIFLTMVDAPGPNGPLPLRQEERFRQRFNVAASRARDQMWLVHSLDPEVDLRPGDLRRRLIEHVRDPGLQLRMLDAGQSRVESVLEDEVRRALVARGYRVRAQVRVGFYRVDLIAEDATGRKAAIECDGDRIYPAERIPEDMARQSVLERLGWTFIRVRATEWFRDPEGTLERMMGELARLGIEPCGSEPPVPADREEVSSELQDRVVRRAFELLAAWGFRHGLTASPGRG